MPKTSTVPNFLYIGAPKAGSSWLFEALREHPEVFVPDAKDVQFFDKFYDKGWEWYQGFFRKHTSEIAVGEISHDYFLYPDAAARIHRHLPHARLISCLREPGDLTLSAYRYARNHAGEFDTGLRGYSRLPISRRQIAYLSNLKRFYALFPREQILVTFFDDLREDPSKFISNIYRFIGVDDGFRPTALNQRINTAKRARIGGLAKAAYRISQLLRAVGLANLVGAAKRNPAFDKLLYRPIGNNDLSQLSKEESEALEEIRQENRTSYPPLEELVGRDVPPSWYQ